MSEFSVSFDLHFRDPEDCAFVASGFAALANDRLEVATAHFHEKGTDLGIDPSHPTWGIESFDADRLKCSGTVTAHAHGDFAPVPFLKSLAGLGASIVLATVVDESNRRRRLAFEDGKKASFAKLVARLNAEDPDFALNQAVVRGRLKDVIAALEAGANPNGSNSGFPHVVHSMYQNVAVAGALIDAGADVDAVAVDGDNALRCAIKNEQFGAVEKLIAAGADVNAGNEAEDWRPLHCAARLEPEDRLHVIRLLVDAGARYDDATTASMSPLLLTVYEAARNTSGRSGVDRESCVAASLGAIDLLLQAGCSPDATYNGYGNLLDSAGSAREIIEKVQSLGITESSKAD